MDDWPDPNPMPPTDCGDVVRELNLLSRQVLELQLEIEEQRWGRWFLIIGMAVVLWRLW